MIKVNNAGIHKFDRPREMILTPNMVSQSSKYNENTGPEKALDGDTSINSQSHTQCGDGKDIWYKIEFGGEHLVQEVKFINVFDDPRKARMDGSRVYVIQDNMEELCATFYIPTDAAGTTFSVECNDMLGDGVILRGKVGKADYCIHMFEVDVSESVKIGEIFKIFLFRKVQWITYSEKCDKMRARR